MCDSCSKTIITAEDIDHNPDLVDSLVDAVDVSPDLGEDWREKIYSGKTQLDSDAFIEEDPIWTLVKHGEKPTRPECGQFKQFMICDNLERHAGVKVDGVDYTNKLYHKRQWWYCKDPLCPICALKGWAVGAAGSAERRLKYAASVLNMKIEHFVVSPPQNLDITFEKLKKLTLKAMLVRGIVAGLWIYHHFRYHGANETFEGERAHYFVSPHFHVLAGLQGGYGSCRKCTNCWLDKKENVHILNRDKCVKECNGFNGVTRRAFEKDGFIVKCKAERKTIGGSIWYQLSHASVRRDAKKHVVVNYFGLMARNKLKIPKGSLPQKEHLCKICGGELHHGYYLGDCADYLRLLDVLGYRKSDGVIADYFDEKGVPLWRSVSDGG